MSAEAVEYEIRWARVEDWEPAMKMVWRTFLKFEAADYTEEGIRNFLEFITDEQLYHAFLQGNYQMLVAVCDEQIVGVASVRNCNHLSLLFVEERYHRRGIGSALMERFCGYLKYEAGEDFMTLNAAPYAVEFYHKIGFSDVGPEEDVGGIRVTSMEKYF